MTKKDLGVLAVLVSAMTVAATPFHMATAKDLGKLVDDGFAEANDEIKDGDKIATRATEAGIAAWNEAFAPKVATMDPETGAVTITDPAVSTGDNSNAGTNEGSTGNEGNNTNVSTAAIAVVRASGFAPSIVRAGRSGRNLYDFDSLNVGDIIFVPKTAERENPAKSLASTVSGATARFAEPTGNMKTVNKTIYKLGEDGKRLKGDDGKLIVDRVEPTTVPETRETRKFAIEPVEAGKTYGDYVAPGDGAVIYRSA